MSAMKLQRLSLILVETTFLYYFLTDIFLLNVIRWRNVAPFVADSFCLFFSADSGLTYSPIARGIPGSDSTYLWTVPDTNSTQCLLMLWAYQNATGWDFSDGPFTISDGSGVSDHPPSTIHHPPFPLRVTPNPFVFFASVPGHASERFALYDVSGRRVGTYPGAKVGEGLRPGVYFLKREGEEEEVVRVVKIR